MSLNFEKRMVGNTDENCGGKHAYRSRCRGKICAWAEDLSEMEDEMSL